MDSTAATSDKGMATKVMAVARAESKKAKTMATTRMAPSRRAVSRFSMEMRMKSAWRKIWRSIFMPFRQAGLDFFEGAVEAVREFEGIGSWLFLDAENHRRLAVVRTDTRVWAPNQYRHRRYVSYQYRLPIMRTATTVSAMSSSTLIRPRP
jgi:hypothetical protein